MVRAVRSIRAGAAVFGFKRKPRLSVVKPQTAVLLHAQPAAPEPPAPRSRRPRNALILALLVLLSLLVSMKYALLRCRQSSFPS